MLACYLHCGSNSCSMKKTHDNESRASSSVRRNRVLVSGAFVAALAMAGVDYARRAATIPQSSLVALPQLDSAELVRFVEVERALETLPIEPDGTLTIDSRVESALAQATTHLPPERPLPEIALQRHDFLIRKALPGAAGATFADLFTTYVAYRQAAAPWLIGAAALADEADRLVRLHALRRAHFAAPIADALFGKEEHLAQYMLALRRLEQDSTLSASEKEAAAAKLQVAYEDASSVTP